MIQGMLSRASSLYATGFAIQWISLFGSVARTGAATDPSDSAGYKSTPQLNVRVYSFPGLAPGLLQAAEMEASRLLGDVRLNLNWVDCTSRVVSATCMTDRLATDLAVRVLAKALPQASANALGIAGTNVGEAT